MCDTRGRCLSEAHSHASTDAGTCESRHARTRTKTSRVLAFSVFLRCEATLQPYSPSLQRPRMALRARRAKATSAVQKQIPAAPKSRPEQDALADNCSGTCSETCSGTCSGVVQDCCSGLFRTSVQMRVFSGCFESCACSGVVQEVCSGVVQGCVQVLFRNVFRTGSGLFRAAPCRLPTTQPICVSSKSQSFDDRNSPTNAARHESSLGTRGAKKVSQCFHLATDELHLSLPFGYRYGSCTYNHTRTTRNTYQAIVVKSRA